MHEVRNKGCKSEGRQVRAKVQARYGRCAPGKQTWDCSDPQAAC